MNVKTFQARTLPDALELIRQEMGPDATVLGTEAKSSSIWNRLLGNQFVEVTAMIPVRQNAVIIETPVEGPTTGSCHDIVAAPSPIDQRQAFSESYRDRFKQFASDEQPASLLESLMGQQERLSNRLPAALFRLYNDLIDSDVDDRFARELIEEVQRHSTPAELSSVQRVVEKTSAILVSRIDTVPQINTHQDRRVIALIGPTGVGKTTTIAKLAANLRLRDKRRVGLITVDTYRIAAVEQLRAYAQIIDLPMEVVTTPHEMRSAVAKLSDLDIVLIDTAGRSSHDEMQIQELKSMLSEAHTDEIQLVLSSVASARHLMRLVDHFGVSNPTSLLLTKLDEATNHGHLLPLLCGRLPVSYTTHGQNVPDDIQPANPQRLIESILN